MAYITQTYSTSKVFSALTNAYENTAAYIANYRVYLKTKAELETLGPRELSDLGISASDINRIAHEAAFGN